MPSPPRLPRCPPYPPGTIGAGRTHCGVLEAVLWRQWPTGPAPGPALVAAVDHLAALPEHLKDRLARHLAGIYLGPGGVPDLDMQHHMRGQQIEGHPPDHLWNDSAGRYDHDQAVIVIGDRPSASATPALHEVGHALDILDGMPSIDADFTGLYRRCGPMLHPWRVPHELFAECFARLALGTGLATLLGSDPVTVDAVTRYLARRYRIGG